MMLRLLEVQTRTNVNGKIYSQEYMINCIREHMRCITRWSVGVHDKDTYTLEDESVGHIPDGYKVGDIKPEHIHVMLQLKQSRDSKDIAKWFDIDERFVLRCHSKSKSNQHKYMDMCLYLIHGNDANKYQYSPSIVESNFDYELEMQRYKLYLEGSKATKKIESVIEKVSNEGMPLSEAESVLGTYTFLKNDMLLKKAREKYITEVATMPPFKLNMYIEGKGGVGKTLASRVLARSIYPGLRDEECFFEIGSKGSRFEGYTGQPIIIWNEVRSKELVAELGRTNLLDLMDPYPSKKKQNVKYSSITLINSVNIFNGIESYQAFLEGLTASYKSKGNVYEAEDKSQGYRRLPLIVKLDEEYFDILLNKGFMQNTREFEQYIQYSKVTGNFGTAMKLLGDKAKPVLISLTEPIIEAKQEVESKANKADDSNPTEIDFSQYGKKCEIGEMKIEEQPTLFDDWEIKDGDKKGDDYNERN